MIINSTYLCDLTQINKTVLEEKFIENSIVKQSKTMIRSKMTKKSLEKREYLQCEEDEAPRNSMPFYSSKRSRPNSFPYFTKPNLFAINTFHVAVPPPTATCVCSVAQIKKLP